MPLSRAEKTEPNVGKLGVRIVGQKGKEGKREGIGELKSWRRATVCGWPKADDERMHFARGRARFNDDEMG